MGINHQPPTTNRQMVDIRLIAALDDDRVIGDSHTNTIPWHLPSDLRHFKALTKGHVVVMGRRTYESIGKALPQRVNLVLTRNHNYQVPGCIRIASLQAALTWAKRFSGTGVPPILYIIGGSAVYEAFLPYASRLELTRVNTKSKGDVRFPDVDWSQWQKTAEKKKQDKKSGLCYVFETWVRRGDDERR